MEQVRSADVRKINETARIILNAKRTLIEIDVAEAWIEATIEVLIRRSIIVPTKVQEEQ